MTDLAFIYVLTSGRMGLSFHIKMAKSQFPASYFTKKPPEASSPFCSLYRIWVNDLRTKWPDWNTKFGKTCNCVNVSKFFAISKAIYFQPASYFWTCPTSALKLNQIHTNNTLIPTTPTKCEHRSNFLIKLAVCVIWVSMIE